METPTSMSAAETLMDGWMDDRKQMDDGWLMLDGYGWMDGWIAEKRWMKDG